MNVKFATVEDVPLILKFIKELTDYEKLLDQVVVTEILKMRSMMEEASASIALRIEILSGLEACMRY